MVWHMCMSVFLPHAIILPILVWIPIHLFDNLNAVKYQELVFSVDNIDQYYLPR